MIFFIIWREKCNSLLAVKKCLVLCESINDFKLITTNRKKEQRIKTILLISHKFLAKNPRERIPIVFDELHCAKSM